MGKVFNADELRLVCLIERDTTIKGYDIVKVLGRDACVSVLDDTKYYPFSKSVPGIRCADITAIESTHSKYSLDKLQPKKGLVFSDCIEDFVNENGTDSTGTFYFVNYDKTRVRMGNLRLVALLERDSTFIGYDLVEVDHIGSYCRSVFDKSKSYNFSENGESLSRNGITALNSKHMKFDKNQFGQPDGFVTIDSLKEFVSKNGTDSTGTFYFPNYKGDKVKKYGDCWSKQG